MKKEAPEMQESPGSAGWGNASAGQESKTSVGGSTRALQLGRMYLVTYGLCNNLQCAINAFKALHVPDRSIFLVPTL